MKRLVLCSFIIICMSSLAFGQNMGSIGLFADDLGTNCNISDTTPGTNFMHVYVVHVGTDGSTASQFKVEPTAGVAGTMNKVGHSSPFMPIGDPLTGISIAYQNCRGGTFMILDITFMAFGTTAACEMFSIIPDPAATSGMVEITDCSNPILTLYFTRGGQARVNSDGSCDCNVATKQTSWGGIKALYR